MRVGGKNSPWLIRSSGKILGPFLEREVSEKLRQREIGLLDEISKPMGRWQFVRDEPAFARIVEELRVKNLRTFNDDTTSTIGVNTNSGLTQTQTATPMEPDELTQEITMAPNTNTVQDVMFQSVDDLTIQRPKASQEAFTHDGDFIANAQADKTARWVWILSAVIVLMTTSFVLFKRFVAQPIQNKEIFNESYTLGLLSLENGDYKRAYELFDRANQIAPNDRSIYLYLGILKIQFADQPFAGRKLLEQISNGTEYDPKKVLTGLGLASLHENDPMRATNYLNKALDVDPLYQPAIVNLGAVALARESWADAISQLLLAIRDGSHDGAEHLMFTEAILKQFEKNNDKSILIDGIKYLRDFIDKNKDYQFEAAIASTYLEILAGQKFDAPARITALLDRDPYATEEHRHQLFIYRGRISWSRVAQWCLRFTQDQDPIARTIALESLCLFKAGDLIEANKKIADAIQQQPKDPLVLSVYGLILDGLNSTDKARAAAAKAVEFDLEKRYAQPRRLSALLCRKAGDAACEKKYWEELRLIQSDSLDAMAGLARLNVEAGQVTEAEKIVTTGMRISEGYRPLISVRQLLDVKKKKQKVQDF